VNEKTKSRTPNISDKSDVVIYNSFPLGYLTQPLNYSSSGEGTQDERNVDNDEGNDKENENSPYSLNPVTFGGSGGTGFDDGNHRDMYKTKSVAIN
jgi:hypothetical protein